MSNDPDTTLRDEVGRAVGFVIGVWMQTYDAGRPPTPGELCIVLEQYRVKFKAFTPEVEQVVKGVLHGLTFALHDSTETTRL